MSDRRDLGAIVRLGESSALKVALNQGVANLFQAQESWFRPHLCLNGEEGLRNMEKVREAPEKADTEFRLSEHPIISGGDIWLNIHFWIFVNGTWVPDNVAELTPRQSAHIIRDLSREFQKMVLGIIKTWYFEEFLVGIQKGLSAISWQFENGDLLLESDEGNRVLDIHGGRSIDVPYVEWDLVGDQLFRGLFYGGTCFEHGSDGYERCDQIIADRRIRQKGAVEGLLGLIREFHQ